jgi:surface antigen
MSKVRTSRSVFVKAYTKRVKRHKRKAVRLSILALNIVIVSTVLVFASKQSSSQTVRESLVKKDDTATPVNPLDTVSSTDIAVSIAKLADLPETTAIENAADSANLQINAVVSEKEFVDKPQIITSTIKTKSDIVQHTVVEGEKLADLVAKYGVTSDTIKWSNSLTSDTLVSGKVLVIPPSNGVMYTFGSGDTIDKVAETYKSTTDQIIAFNDAELSGVAVGQVIFIPNGQKPAPRVVAAPRTTTSTQSSASFSTWYGYNGYSYGYCTYYAAARAGAPNGWGNANTWAIGARQTPGWVVSKTPVPGAIAQTAAMSYWGHVAIVEDVSLDGTQIKISDMNNLAGWGRVGYSDWISAGAYQWYIYRSN